MTGYTVQCIECGKDTAIEDAHAQDEFTPFCSYACYEAYYFESKDPCP